MTEHPIYQIDVRDRPNNGSNRIGAIVGDIRYRCYGRFSGRKFDLSRNSPKSALRIYFSDAKIRSSRE